MRRFVLILGMASAGIFGCNEANLVQSVETDLVDSLEITFNNVRVSLENREADQFIDLMEPAEADRIKAAADAKGYTTLSRFIERRLNGCPDLDTLDFFESKQSDNWVRLTYTYVESSRNKRNELVRYTFILFHKEADQWKLSAVNYLDKERYDSYGSLLSFHETELPLKLRFPRF